MVAREDERCVGLIWAVPREDKLWVLECFSVSAVVENILYKQVREAFGFAGNVAMIRQKNRVQLRVIHAYEVLQLYARQHADTAGRVRVVGDEDITENNGVYVWEKDCAGKKDEMNVVARRAVGLVVAYIFGSCRICSWKGAPLI